MTSEAVQAALEAARLQLSRNIDNPIKAILNECTVTPATLCTGYMLEKLETIKRAILVFERTQRRAANEQMRIKD